MSGESLRLISLVDGGITAVLQTNDLCEVRLPAFLLPKSVAVGEYVKLTLQKDQETTDDKRKQLLALQQHLLEG
eukprot:m.80562 g.80562  ORF g.80562 m.80562 type:complete len:74 (-) comp14547_c0_seq1:1798-2019(-)